MKKLLLASVSAAALFATPAFGQSNTSSVNQSGQFNDAQVTQTGSGGSATVTQTGDGKNVTNANEIRVIQQGAGAEAVVSQAGSDRNEAEVRQNVAGGIGFPLQRGVLPLLMGATCDARFIRVLLIRPIMATWMSCAGLPISSMKSLWRWRLTTRSGRC